MNPAAQDGINNKYCLPANYTTNKAITYDDDVREVYWNKDRQQMSQSYQRAVYKWADKIISEHNCHTVADVGCGFADKLYKMIRKHRNVRFYGIDQPNIINLCRSVYKNGNWLSVDLEKEPEDINLKFDLAISSDVIEHLENPDSLINYLKSIIKKDGYIIISTPDRDVIRGRGCLHSPNKYHVREWNSSEFSQYVQSHGLKILEHKLLPAMGFCLSKRYLIQMINLIRKGIPISYNQAVLVQLAD